MSDADYAEGAKFALVLNYNVQSMPADGKFAIDCYWEAAAGGDSEATQAHESDILRGGLILVELVAAEIVKQPVEVYEPLSTAHEGRDFATECELSQEKFGNACVRVELL